MCLWTLYNMYSLEDKLLKVLLKKINHSVFGKIKLSSPPKYMVLFFCIMPCWCWKLKRYLIARLCGVRCVYYMIICLPVIDVASGTFTSKGEIYWRAFIFLIEKFLAPQFFLSFHLCIIYVFYEYSNKFL